MTEANKLNNMGIRAQQAGQGQLAVQYLEAACQLNPHDPQLFYNLGWVWQSQGHLAAAVTCYETALQLKPDYVTARLNLGVALGDLGQVAAGMAQLQTLLQIAPQPEVYYNLGNLWRAQGQLHQAINYYQQAVQLAPDMAEAHHNLGVVWAMLDDLVAAKAAYQQALRYQPDNILWQLEHDSLAPAIMPPHADLKAWHTQFAETLQRYAPIDLLSWLNELTASNVKPPFYLTYHGYNDRSIKEDFAALFKIPPQPPSRKRSNPPYKVGFVVTKQHEGIFNKLMLGLLNHWSEPDLTPIIVCPAESIGLIQPYLQNETVTFFTLSPHFVTALQELYTAQFDLLYFWEVGTDALNYALPFFRLAPVQCTSWGIPATTGLPMMDYYLSGEALEVAEADSHYTEQLIRLKQLPTYYERPTVAETDVQGFRNLAGLTGLTPPTIYLCPQSLFKLHPDFDPILAEILRRDPQGELWLIEGMIPSWQERLLARLTHHYVDITPRIRFIPRQNRQGFLQLLAQAHVMLDPLHYGGTNTSYEGLAMGLPIVTMPTEYLKGRITTGCYRQMGLLDCVVDSPEAYIEKAVKLGTDPAYRAQIKAEILARCHVLYEDLAAIHEMTAFFKQAIQRRY